MGSADILDLEQLLAPVSQDKPCGESLRWDPVYDEIKAARREDSKDPLEAGEALQANWPLVIEKASEALARKSKDLMLAGYLCEALVRVHGFAGLRDGLRLINALVGRYWDGLYPLTADEDLEPRAAPLVWLTEGDRGARLPNRVRDIPLVPGGSDGEAYSWSFWKSRFPQPKGETEDSDAFATRQAVAAERAKLFDDATAAASADHCATTREDIGECQSELSRLGTLLDEKFGRAAPGTTALRQSLEECGALVRRILKDKGVLEPEAGEEGAGVEEHEGAAESMGTISGPIKSRADALRRLQEVAAFFRQTEPHSPISYLVSRAAGWGQLSLEQLLDELVKDGAVRDQISELLGFKRPAG
jgi:type VI secretion system protein ImpA